jgi:hypothetical protein
MPHLPKLEEEVAAPLGEVIGIETARARTARSTSRETFGLLHVAVREWMLAGHGLADVEQHLIDPASISPERKAVLWLLAWSMLAPSDQIAEVEAHIELLSA